jgi:hypothetical protein
MWNLKFIKFKPWFAIEEAAWPVLGGGGESHSEEEKDVFKRCNNINLLKGDRVFTLSPFELEPLERGRGGAGGGRRWGEVEALDTRRSYKCRWLSVHLITHIALVVTAHVFPSYLLTLTGIVLNLYFMRCSFCMSHTYVCTAHVYPSYLLTLTGIVLCIRRLCQLYL